MTTATGKDETGLPPTWSGQAKKVQYVSANPVMQPRNPPDKRHVPHGASRPIELLFHLRRRYRGEHGYVALREAVLLKDIHRMCGLLEGVESAPHPSLEKLGAHAFSISSLARFSLGGSSSLSSAIAIDGRNLMNSRNHIRNQANEPAVIAISTQVGL